MTEILNLHDLEAIARARLPQMAWDYYAAGADDEHCVRRSCDAYAKIALHYRVPDRSNSSTFSTRCPPLHFISYN